MGLLALGFGLAFGLAAWRNMPAIEGASTGAVVVLVLVALAAAFVGGRRFGSSASAGAVAQAHAEAQSLASAASSQHVGQSVQVFVAGEHSPSGRVPSPAAAAGGPAAALRQSLGLDAGRSGLDVDELVASGALDDGGLLEDRD